MIIGINGKMGHGKDTVGEIIKTIDSKNSWEIKKFAAKLKEIAHLLTGIPKEKFEDQDFKSAFLPEVWNKHALVSIDSRKNPPEKIIQDMGSTIAEITLSKRKFERVTRLKGLEGFVKTEIIQHPFSVREFLQLLGTECVRNTLHKNAWVNALIADYVKKDDKYPNWIVTDVRFPNEAAVIKNAGGIVIRVVRNTNNDVPNHVSESSLDNYTFDYVIENYGSIEDLHYKVKQFLLNYKLI